MSSTTEDSCEAGRARPRLLPVVESWPGRVVGDTYRLRQHLASGGSSHVFEAEHLRLGKRFALKVFRPELAANGNAVRRFRREATAFARIRSEHVVDVVDCGEFDGVPYVVMELCEGRDLRALLEEEGRLPARRAVALCVEAARGLTALHATGLVHRDVKPENLFVTRRWNGEDWCKILDLGVAKSTVSSATAQGALIGTLRYMAPEQISDSSRVSPATDIYALGAVLYECLTGRAVFQDVSAPALMFKIVNVPPMPLQDLCPALPAPLSAVVMACLSKVPHGRPRTANELALELSQALTPSSVGGDVTITDATAVEGVVDASTIRTAHRPIFRVLALLGLATISCCLGGWVTAERNQRSGRAEFCAPVGAGTAPAALVSHVAKAAATAIDAPDAAASSAAVPPCSPRRVKGPRPARAEPLVGGFDSANPYNR